MRPAHGARWRGLSERLDIVPAEFFVHRHIRGKWACKCCPILVQEPALPQIIDKGLPTGGLLAHTLVSRFVALAAAIEMGVDQKLDAVVVDEASNLRRHDERAVGMRRVHEDDVFFTDDH